MDTEEDFQPETSKKKRYKFKPINWVSWSKEFEKYVVHYKIAWISGVLISYFIRNNLKRPDATAMALPSQTEQDYWNINLDNRNRRYVEDLKQVYSL